MLTPKHTTFDNTKLVEMKQSYPILQEQVKQLRKELDDERGMKEEFLGAVRGLLGRVRGQGEMEGVLGELEYRITSYQYP